jgi:DDE family transposase
MATECRHDSFDFGTVKGRAVVGAFDGGVISSDAGALLLGATNRAINLVGRFAACFSDARDADSIEHSVETLVGQRVFGIALGYQDLNDHAAARSGNGRFGGQARGAAQRMRTTGRQVDSVQA